MFNILLYTSRLPESEEISKRLAARENYIVHKVSNLREAGTLLTRQRIDLAIVAVSPNDSLVYSLNMLQEGLPILLIAEISNQYVSERQRKMAWGIVTYERLTEVFPDLDFLEEPKDKVEEIFLKDPEPVKRFINTKKLSKLISVTLQKYDLEMILLTRHQELIGIHSRGDQDQIVRVGRFVRNNHSSKSEKGQMTWFTDKKSLPHIPTQSTQPESFLLLTLPYDDFLLTIASKEHGSVLKMRQAARLLTTSIRKVESDSPDSEFQIEIDTHMASKKPNHSKSLAYRPNLSAEQYVLVWKTLRPLSSKEQKELNKILPLIGKSYGCTLTPITINSDYIQVLSSCPTGRTSAWLVQTYKNGALKHIQNNFDVSSNLWMDGYYARPSKDPLSDSELALYLGAKKGAHQSVSVQPPAST